jgi:hypothetical protein
MFFNINVNVVAFHDWNFPAPPGLRAKQLQTALCSRGGVLDLWFDAIAAAETFCVEIVNTASQSCCGIGYPSKLIS